MRAVLRVRTPFRLTRTPVADLQAVLPRSEQYVLLVPSLQSHCSHSDATTLRRHRQYVTIPVRYPYTFTLAQTRLLRLFVSVPLTPSPSSAQTRMPQECQRVSRCRRDSTSGSSRCVCPPRDPLEKAGADFSRTNRSSILAMPSGSRLRFCGRLSRLTSLSPSSHCAGADLLSVRSDSRGSFASSY